jgi:hypothetical protein
MSWIYGSISLDLFGTMMRLGSTAQSIWTTIDNLFLDNTKSHVI